MKTFMRFLNETTALVVCGTLYGVNRLLGRGQEAARVWREFLGLLDEGIEAERKSA